MNIRPSLLNVSVMTLDSGSLISEFDWGSVICTSSGGLNWVVNIKNVNSKNATSTSGVISILIPALRGLNFGMGTLPC
jgi:hypothetical protein